MRYAAICLFLLTAVHCVARTQEQDTVAARKPAPAVAASAPKADTPAPLKDPATEAFQRGSKLVDRNCAECMGVSVKGLSEGIDALKKSIELGYTDPASAHRLLRDAYANRGALFKRADPERKRYKALRNAEVAEVVRLDPSDLDNRIDYILNVRKSTQTDQTTALRELVTEHPEFAPGQYALSRLLFAAGAIDEALPHAERWLVEAKGIEAQQGAVALLESTPVADLRRILASAPDFHPAQFALALRLFEKGQATEGLQHARLALEKAPPAVATGYAGQVNADLEAMHQQEAAETLRRDFRTKLRKGDAEMKREQ